MRRLPSDLAAKTEEVSIKKKILSLAAIMGMVLMASSAADARGNGGGAGFGASSFSPGQQFRQNGPVTGYHGASGYAPGHLYRLNGAVSGYPGASGYAPGRNFKPH
jgi:hypothetical protein